MIRNAELTADHPRMRCRFIPEVTKTRLSEDGMEEIDTNDPAEGCLAFECSVCGFPMMFGDCGWFDEMPPYTPQFNYCPNCGTPAEGGQGA